MDDYHPSWIESISQKLYSFVFALLPDELQCKQLVIDSVTKVMMENTDVVKNIPKDSFSLRKVLAPLIFKKAYELAKIRAYQLDGLMVENNEIEPNWKSFYESLSFEQRALSFLDLRLNMTVEEMMGILGLKRFELIESLHFSRNKLSMETPFGG